ncbi:hypothetical protein [Epibacterium ulvae]|uniref:hypothetical protein n=1 Tax=Epibacterium ulvae TaxID=1156985 RepID=UPI0024935C98|nr:hypothetical protein [Epibacterium ulvae]
MPQTKLSEAFAGQRSVNPAICRTRFISGIRWSVGLMLGLLATAPGAQAETMPPLSQLSGHTLLGATVESGAVWSVYLAPDGRAAFSYASGETGSARWRAADEKVICFAFDTSGEETCKRGSAYGIGSGWSTVYPREDGGWRPYQEDPHGSSRIFAAWPGRHRHNPGSFTGDLRDSLPGRLYIDDPGRGVFAIDMRPDGTGAVLSARGVLEVEQAEYGARHACINEECVEIRIGDGRLWLDKRGSDRVEGNLIYLAHGRYTPPPSPEPGKTAEPAAKLDVSDPPTAAKDAPYLDDCFGLFDVPNTPECRAAAEKAMAEASPSATAIAQAGSPSDTTAADNDAPAFKGYDVEYPWLGRYHDIPTRNLKTWDKGAPVRVDFENGSPRIGGRVLVPGFTPDVARIMAVTESFALIRFSGSMLPDGCAEAYRWLWVTGPDYGLMSAPFGACTKAKDVTVEWKGMLLFTTITPDSGVASTFRLFPTRSDDRDPMTVSAFSGPSVEFPAVAEEDWKMVERRETAERLAAEEQKRAQDRRKDGEDAAQRRAAELEAARQPAKPTGRLDGGNVFDILAQDAVQSAITASENGDNLREVFTQHFNTATYLPENRRVGDVFLGVACGPDGCSELQFMLIHDAAKGVTFGIVSAGLFTSIQFGSKDWLKDKDDLLLSEFKEMMDEMGARMAAELASK